jgi:hypothetical protein
LASISAAAFAESSVHDSKDKKKWIFRIPILSHFGGQARQHFPIPSCTV